MDDELHPVVSAIAVVAAIGSGVLASVVTWVAFRGGMVPLVGCELEGGAVQGMVAFAIGFPLISTVGYWLGAVVAMPLQWLFTRGRRRC